jgi:hypothetical protein
VNQSIAHFENSTWSEFVNKSKDPCGGIHPEVKHAHHRAAHLLDRFRVQGVPVVMNTEPWSLDRKLSALQCGTHQLANQLLDFL